MPHLVIHFFLLLSLLTSSLVCATAKPIFDGFYAGGALGGSFASAHDRHASTIVVDDIGRIFSTRVTLDLDNHMAKNAFEGSLFLGYGFTKSKAYLGGELALTASNYKMANRQDTSSRQNTTLAGLNFLGVGVVNNREAQISVNPVQFAFAIRPGFLLTPSSLLYARVGGAVARVKFNSSITTISSFTSVVGVADTTTPAVFTTSSSKQGVILQLGGGLEHAISDRWTLRLDYIYSDYGSLRARNATFESYKLPVLIFQVPGSTQVTATNRTRVIAQTIMLGAAFHF